MVIHSYDMFIRPFCSFWQSPGQCFNSCGLARLLGRFFGQKLEVRNNWFYLISSRAGFDILLQCSTKCVHCVTGLLTTHLQSTMCLCSCLGRQFLCSIACRSKIGHWFTSFRCFFGPSNSSQRKPFWPWNNSKREPAP